MITAKGSIGIKNLIGLLFAAVLVITALSGCGMDAALDPDAFSLYYVNSAKTGILAVEYVIESDEDDLYGTISELIEMLRAVPEKRQYEPPMTPEMELEDFYVNDKVLTLNFDSRYQDVDRTLEVLNRAAIVRTFTQLEDIDYVSFQVEQTPLTDHYGNMIGNMSADTFIFNVGNEINTYEKVELKLYFANETGNKLIPVFRSVVYNSNISMERVALEQLIIGPNADFCFPTITKDAKINSVNIRDGVCYVDLDPSFLSQPYSVTTEVAIYSIVNTLVELPEVNKVEFTVLGEEPFIYMDSAISGSYERNLDLIEE